MATLLQFSKNIRRRGRQVENGATELTRQVSKRTLRALVLATPVDTGEARSNWRVGIGAPATAVIPPYSPYPKGSKANGQGTGEGANASAAIAAGNARINGVRGTSGGLKTAIFITNNTRQIDFLNSGSSQQAPAGFVQVAAAEARAALAGFRIFKR